MQEHLYWGDAGWGVRSMPGIEAQQMKTLQEVLRPVLSNPTPEALVALQGVLLSMEQPGQQVDQALEIAGRFYAYLTELQSKITARDYSELASRLDIGAVGAVALENVLAAGREAFWQRLVIGGVAELLMVAASRQYIKGWQAETALVHTQAIWYLTEALWRTSVRSQPDLRAEQRWQTIQALLAPISTPDTPAPQKAVILGLTFQLVLLMNLVGLLSEAP
jgi:hypothetical protein